MFLITSIHLTFELSFGAGSCKMTALEPLDTKALFMHYFPSVLMKLLLKLITPPQSMLTTTNCTSRHYLVLSFPCRPRTPPNSDMSLRGFRPRCSLRFIFSLSLEGAAVRSSPNSLLARAALSFKCLRKSANLGFDPNEIILSFQV